MTSNIAETAQSVDAAAVRGVVDGIAESWAANSADGFADAYSEDASLILSGDRFFKGREVIRQMTKHQFATAHKGTTLLQNIVDLRFLSPVVAVVVTEGGVLTAGETEPAPERALRATWVMAKNGDIWEIAAYQNGRMADVPLQGE